MSEKIKPCPFCEGTGILQTEQGSCIDILECKNECENENVVDIDNEISFVECDRCGSRGSLEYEEEDAIAKWNTRHKEVWHRNQFKESCKKCIVDSCTCEEPFIWHECAYISEKE